MITGNWYNKWQTAYEQASFYKSDKNSREYWDSVADSGSSGLGGDAHIAVLEEYLLTHKYIDQATTILDAGCGLGDYTVSLARMCQSVTAMDYSDNMIEQCKSRCQSQGLTNVNYLVEDIKEYNCEKSVDGVLACLNPSTYSPDVFTKLIQISKKYVVYFSMDTAIEEVSEPIYNGTNSVKYPENLLKEMGLHFTKIPYEYLMEKADGSRVSIPFAYLVIEVNCVVDKKHIVQ